MLPKNVIKVVIPAISIARHTATHCSGLGFYQVVIRTSYLTASACLDPSDGPDRIAPYTIYILRYFAVAYGDAIIRINRSQLATKQ